MGCINWAPAVGTYTAPKGGHMRQQMLPFQVRRAADTGPRLASAHCDHDISRICRLVQA